MDIALERTGDGQLIVPVVIEGKPPAPFILDTGASQTVINTDLVSAMSLSAAIQVKSEVVSAAGEEAGGPAYVLRDLTVGPRDFGDVVAVSASMEDISTPKLPIAGILGQDFLANQIIDFDFPAKRLRIHPAQDAVAPPQGSVAIPFRKLSAGLLVVDATLGSATVFPAVIDLGAQASIVNTLGAHGVGTPAGVAAQAIGADGAAAAVVPQRFAHLSIGSVGFDDLSLFVSDLPVFTQLGLSKGPALILGLDLLGSREVILDYRTQRLILGPKVGP